MAYHEVDIFIVWKHLFLTYNKTSLIAFAICNNEIMYLNLIMYYSLCNIDIPVISLLNMTFYKNKKTQKHNRWITFLQ